MNILFYKKYHTSMGSVELLTAADSQHHFPRHFHETFPFGVVTNGILGFHYRGENVSAWQGTINLANPGEVHDGYPIADCGWQYRMFYVDSSLLQVIMDQGGGQNGFPWFSKGVIQDDNLARQIAQLHYHTQNQGLSPLAMETRLFQVLETLIDQYAEIRPQRQTIQADHHNMQHVIEMMREDRHLSVTLKELASMCGYSVGYFIRAFRAYSGMTPHKYQLVCRMERARTQLLQAQPISQVASQNGFVDQSHFSHTFKHFYGYSPGVCTA